MPSPKVVKEMIAQATDTVTASKTYSGSNTFSGTNTFSGQVDHSGTMISPEVVQPTAAYTLTSADYGKTFVATSLCRKFTFPLAAAGLDGVTFTFVQGYASTAAGTELWLDVVSGDKINSGTTGVGIRLQTTDDAVGYGAKVICDGSNWWTVSRDGTWAAASAA